MSVETIEIQIDMDIYKAIETCRNSFKQSHNEILRELLRLDQDLSGNDIPLTNSFALSGNDRQTNRLEKKQKFTRNRSSEPYGFVFLGQHYVEDKLKDAYISCLNLMKEKRPLFLNGLADKKTRGRLIISKDPTHLYPKSPHLADDPSHFAEYHDGFYLDVNLSQQQVEARIRIACEVAELEFGEHVKLEFPK